MDKRDYVMNIHFDSNKNYSASICDEEWEAFLLAAKGKDMNGFTMPLEVLEDLWEPDIIIPVDRLVIIKKGY